MDKNFLITSEKNAIESIVYRYKNEISRFKQINQELKNLQFSVLNITSPKTIREAESRDLKHSISSEIDETDLMLDFQFLNITIIQDMDLIIMKQLNNMLNTSNSNITKEEDECYLKLRVSVSDTNPSTRKAYVSDVIEKAIKIVNSNITNNPPFRSITNTSEHTSSQLLSKDTSNTTDSACHNQTIYSNISSLAEIASSNPASNLHKMNSSCGNNSNSSAVHTIIYPSVIYTISDPDDDEIDIVTSIIQQQRTPIIKNSICEKCLNKYFHIEKLSQELKTIKRELIKEVSGMLITKQDLIAKLTIIINRINYIRLKLYEMRNSIDILKKVECANYEENNNIYHNTLKKASTLVEAIQESIRKQNLNMNFIIINY